MVYLSRTLIPFPRLPFRQRRLGDHHQPCLLRDRPERKRQARRIRRVARDRGLPGRSDHRWCRPRLVLPRHSERNPMAQSRGEGHGECSCHDQSRRYRSHGNQEMGLEAVLRGLPRSCLLLSIRQHLFDLCGASPPISCTLQIRLTHLSPPDERCHHDFRHCHLQVIRVHHLSGARSVNLGQIISSDLLCTDCPV